MSVHADTIFNMSKYNIPKLFYCDVPKKMVSIRLPIALIKKIESIAKSRGWPLTDVVVTVLDQYAVHEANEKKSSK